MIYLSIPGDPVAWKRAGYNFRKRSIYDQQVGKRESYKIQLLQQFKNQSASLIGEAVRLQVEFIFAPPKSWTKKQQYMAVYERRPVTKRPDLDNLIKFVKDCLTDTVLTDDKLVTRLVCEKFYGKKPQTLIQIEILNEKL